MPKKQRLTKSEQFAAVQTEGKTWSNPLLVLRIRANELGYVRYGLAVGKRVGNAVTRNRIKRRFREAMGQLSPQGGWDIVLIARQGAAEASFQQICAAIGEMLRRSRLVLRTENSPPASDTEK